MTDQTSSPTDAKALAGKQTTPDALEARLSIEQMIKNYLVDIASIREKLKTQKDMFKSSFESDKQFSEVDVEHKAIARKKTEAKQRITKTDAVSVVANQIKTLQEEMKDAQQGLSDYLNQYVMQTQATEFLGPDGEAMSIVRSAKLVKKK